MFLLRYVPDEAVTVAASGAPGGPGIFIPGRSDLWRAFAPKAALALAFLLVFGLAGGWILAGRMLAPLAAHHGGQPDGRERLALAPDRAAGPQRRVP